MRVLIKFLIPVFIGTELGMAAVYFLAALYPQFALTWIDAEFLSNLGNIMLLEFIMAHSGVFFTVIFGKTKTGMPDMKFTTKQKWLFGVLLYFLYLLFAAAFAGWYGIAVYTFLTISRCHFLIFKNDYKLGAEFGKSFARAGCYLFSVMILLLAGIRFGEYDSALNIEHAGGDLDQLAFLNWGFIYFLMIGVINVSVDLIIRRKSKVALDS